jgi:hypothetical protein
MNRIRLISILGLLALLVTLITGCGASNSFDKQIDDIARPYKFDLTGWEFKNLTGEIGQSFKRVNINNATQEVIDYFQRAGEIRNTEATITAIRTGDQSGDLDQLQQNLDELRRKNDSITTTIEKLLEKQARESLSEQGIYSPFYQYVKIKTGFPPLITYLGKAPNLLIISPRDRIEKIKDVMLLPDMTEAEMEEIEAKVADLGYSGLVEGLGGVATYPSYVSDEFGLHFAIETIVHEWMHQYLAFTPLGFRYVLDQIGIRQNNDIVTLNETLADMIGQEMADIIYKIYVPEAPDENPPPDDNGFDFTEEMKAIRRAVDDYLAQGQIEQAEQFMEEKRQYLAQNGYYIRKLNQAYFAFHGAYADSPGSIDPIGEEMSKLRAQSTSLQDFLDKASRITSRDALEKSLK